jgi:hypothetical protein
VLGPVYMMRPGRSQTGMKIEIVNMFTWDRYENHKFLNLFPLPGNFLFSEMAFVSMRCSNVKVTAETGLKCIFVFTILFTVYIHPAVWIHTSLKSVGSVQQAEWLETGLSYFRPGLM